MSDGISGFTLSGQPGLARRWALRRADPGSVTGTGPGYWILHVDLDQ